MPRRKLSDEDVRRLIAEYQQWDPTVAGAESSEAIAVRYGISKSTMYRILEDHGIPIKGARSVATVPSNYVPTLKSQSEAVGVLVEALVEAKMRVKLLELLLIENGIEVPGSPFAQGRRPDDLVGAD